MGRSEEAETGSVPGSRSHLRAVSFDENGEIGAECNGCAARELTIEGLQHEIRSLSTKLRLAKRDAEAEAAEDPLWPRAVRLFDLWREATNHVGCEWTAARFDLVVPSLKRYPDETIERAIAGIAYDPYSKQMRNGKTERYDTWETLFKKTGNIEWYANRAPLDWAPTNAIAPVTEEAKSLGRFVMDRAKIIEEEDDPIALARIYAEMGRRVQRWLDLGGSRR